MPAEHGGGTGAGMELRVVGYFLNVVDHGSVTSAAAHARVAQPSVSRQLRALERELGVELFVRGHGPLRLTAAGERFTPIARDLVGRARRAREVMRSHADGLPFLPRLVCPAATLDHVIAPFVASGGGLVADVLPRAPEDVFAPVARSEADVGVSTAPPPPDLLSRRVAAVPLHAQMPAGHALAGREEIDLAELIRHPLVLVGRGSRIRRVFDEAVVGHRAPTPVAQPDTPVMAQALAAAGQGVCVVSGPPAFGLHSAGIRATTGALKASLFAGWDPEHYAQNEISSFLDRLTTWMSTR